MLKLLWCYIVTNKTTDLSDVYIKYDKKIYNKLYFISIVAGLSTPLVYNNNTNLIYN